MDPPSTAHFTTYIGLSCYTCDKLEEVSSSGDGLLRCSGCRKMWYCSTKCQKTNWSQHKALCKALRFLEQDTTRADELTRSFPMASQNSIETLDRISKVLGRRVQWWLVISSPFMNISRSLKNREFDVLSYEPRCLACARTDIVLRIEAGISQAKPAVSGLMCCPRCKMAFYCCEEHCATARPLHDAPCADLPGGVSQCDVNRHIRLDMECMGVFTAPEAKRLMWRFIPRQTAWTAIKDLNWDTVIGNDVRRAVARTAFADNASSCVRRVSSLASTMMTILFALEQLNTSTAWTNKTTLTIHMIGYPADFSPDISHICEVLLHRLPSLQILTLLFCGSAVAGMALPLPGVMCIIRELDACRYCDLPIPGRNYEDYVRGEGASFEPPDLCVAANAFLTTNDPAQWRRTIKLLIARRIPSVFTAFTRPYAERDQAVLRECGAKLVPSLTVAKNPFGDMILSPDFDKVHGFHAPNAWFTGAFR
ncbi:hypothetical protein FB451DRAFT_1026054 [Mycena latifolia]|nr:hypothetical protein FB451DRAFT_1026054 [Mycena latifolia]